MRFGFIGNGRIAGRHKEAIKRIGGTLERIYDPATALANDAFRPEGSCKALDSEFFDAVDWVVIASPTKCHYDNVKAALGRGKMVICEKPYCLPWQPIIDSPNVFVVMQMRWADLPNTAKKIRVVAARNEEYFRSWKGDPYQTGGLFFDIFIHYVDLARRYKCELEMLVVDHGTQERWIDDFCLMDIDMNLAYEAMYRDIVLRGVGTRPSQVAELHWMLARYTERFGFGQEIVGKVLKVSPSGLV